MTRGRQLLAATALTAAAFAGVAPASVAFAGDASQGAQRFAEQCSAIGAHLPSGVSLDIAESIDPDPVWKSPSSLTSAHGEAVRVPFCRLAGTIDGDIGFEIWLPRQWNSRFLGTGVGGEAGYFNYSDMARGVEQGFVSASSDTGHKRGEPWIGDPRKSENYAHVAYHRLTETAKAIIAAYYSAPAAYSYFVGCSGGGRQGLREMQLYPGDYDGALIGAPGQDVPLLAARFIQVELAQSIPGGVLDQTDWNLISGAATAQCDAQDGLADGVIADPRSCGFKVAQLECRSGQSEGCLSPGKIKAAEAIIVPLRDRQGQTYDFGLLPGITTRPGGMPPLPIQMFGGVIHGDPNWGPGDFDIALDLPAARAKFATMDARSADLSGFAARGGKLMVYHGWADASVQPEASIDFFDRLARETSASRQDYARLYMVPGMQHCRSGNGTDHFGASEDRHATADPQSDMLSALIAWVEHKSAPGPIVARRIDASGTVDRSRPLCPYPQRAVYRGSGSMDRAENFECLAGNDQDEGRKL